MAVEIPTTLINNLRNDLRAAAGLSSYNPDDLTLPTFPSLHESIADFDPSPSYLRCNQCRGRLLRGVLSTICVYCGAHQRRDDAACPQISYNSTFGYRRFLESLKLDGSEAVVLGCAESNSSGGQNAPKDGLVLSELLNLELGWPKDSSESGNISTNKTPTPTVHSVYVAGADLDNFFLDAKTEAAPSVSNEVLIPSEQLESTKGHVYGQGNFGTFQNIQPSDVATDSVENIGGQFSGSFSAWEAEFQAASSIMPPNSRTPDPFLGPSQIELSGPVVPASVSDPGIDIKFEPNGQGTIVESEKDQIRLASGWPQDGLWNTGELGASAKMEQFERSAGHKERENDSSNTVSMQENWPQDDKWQTSISKVSNNSERTAENDDLRDTGEVGASAKMEHFESNRDEKLQESDSSNIVSIEDNWPQDDMWLTSISKVSNNSERTAENVELWDTGKVGAFAKMEQFESNGGEKQQENDSSNIVSIEDNWPQDDMWQVSITKVSNNSERTAENDILNGFAGSRPDIFPNSSSINVSSSAKKTNENDDWNDFASTGGMSDLFTNSWQQADPIPTLTSGQASVVKSTPSNDSKDMAFGIFSESDILSGVSSIQEGATDGDIFQLETLPLDRDRIRGKSRRVSTRRGFRAPQLGQLGLHLRNGEPAKIGLDAETLLAADNNENSMTAIAPADPNIEMLMSQMHDLSFMIEDSLSIPKKTEPVDSAM